MKRATRKLATIHILVLRTPFKLEVILALDKVVRKQKVGACWRNSLINNFCHFIGIFWEG